jgi:hypothetical protein
MGVPLAQNRDRGAVAPKCGKELPGSIICGEFLD